MVTDNKKVIDIATKILDVLDKHLSEENCVHTVKEIMNEVVL